VAARTAGRALSGAAARAERPAGAWRSRPSDRVSLRCGSVAPLLARCGAASRRTDGVLAAVVDEEAQHALVLQVLHELRVVDGPVVLRPVAPDARDEAHRGQRRAVGRRRTAAAACCAARVAAAALLLLILVTAATAARRRPQTGSRQCRAPPRGQQQPRSQRRAEPDGDAASASRHMSPSRQAQAGCRRHAGGPHRDQRRPLRARGRAAATAKRRGSAALLEAWPSAARPAEVESAASELGRAEAWAHRGPSDACG